MANNKDEQDVFYIPPSATAQPGFGMDTYGNFFTTPAPRDLAIAKLPTPPSGAPPPPTSSPGFDFRWVWAGLAAGWVLSKFVPDGPGGPHYETVRDSDGKAQSPTGPVPLKDDPLSQSGSVRTPSVVSVGDSSSNQRTVFPNPGEYYTEPGNYYESSTGKWVTYDPRRIRTLWWSDGNVAPNGDLYSRGWHEGPNPYPNARRYDPANVALEEKTSPTPSITPDPPLVGVETNPGPPKRSKQKTGGKTRKSNTRTIRQPTATRSSSVAPSFAFSNAMFEGRKGLTITGSQRLCDVQRAATTGAVTLTNVASTGTVAANKFQLSPLLAGMPLSDLGYAFMQYRFTRATFSYRPVASTSCTGGIAFGFTPDSYSIAAPTVSQITTLERAQEVPAWGTCTIDAQLDISKLLYQYASGSTAPEVRQTYQGSFLVNGTVVCSPDITTTLGVITLSYTLQLFNMGDVVTLQMPLENHRALVLHRRALFQAAEDGYIARRRSEEKDSPVQNFYLDVGETGKRDSKEPVRAPAPTVTYQDPDPGRNTHTGYTPTAEARSLR